MTSLAGAAVRAEAARVLAEVLDDGRSLKAVLAQRLPALVDPRDRALLEALCFVALRHRRRYDALLRRWVPRALPMRTPTDQRVARLWLVGLAQLDALDLPVHAAVGATVEAVRVLGRAGLAGLFNAVLRRASRERPWPLPDDPAERHSLPDWLWRVLQADWPERAATIAEAGNTEPPLWLRVNTARLARDALRARWQAAAIAAEPGPAIGSLRLGERRPPTQLPGFAEGLVQVQDLAAQLAVEALAPSPGMRVLDACAAPGGKTAQLAEAVGAQGQVIAIDVDAGRLAKVGALLRQLGLDDGRVRLIPADAADPDRCADGAPFDAILLDAPCSATGILRRQPDARWHRRPDDIAPLVQAQARLLDALWRQLRPGGRLLYATCSLLRDENDRQIAAFLARTADARLLPLDARFGHDTGHGRQRFPGDDGGDGFFYALLHREPAG
jgi:16S rRNA (cytosine967-C5)-methyltransferase